MYVLIVGMVLGYFLGKIYYRKEVSGGIPLTDDQLDHIYSVLSEYSERTNAKSGSVSPELPTEIPSASLWELARKNSRGG